MRNAKTITLATPKVRLNTPQVIRQMETLDARIQSNREARRVESRKKASKKMTFVAAIIMAAIMMAAVIGNAAVENARYDSVKSMPTVEVVVAQGDTIDGIASQHRIEGFSDHYLGMVISDINDIHGAIQPGQVLLVPAGQPA